MGLRAREGRGWEDLRIMHIGTRTREGGGEVSRLSAGEEVRT